MKLYNKEHTPLILIMLLCALLVIATNYIFIKRVTVDVQKQMTQNEYDKIWWKDNYIIMKELQKEEVLNYINKLKNESPDLIYKMRQNAIIKENSDKKILSWEAMNELKSNTYIKSNSGAKVSIMEFSDMECPFCIEYHNSKTINNALEKYKETNYIYKNFPLPAHKNAQALSLAAKCIEKVSDWKKYLEFIDSIFTGAFGWEWFSIDKIKPVIKKLEIDEAIFDKCYSDTENNSLVKKEFEQWLKLGINSTPTSVIVNNHTWEYTILSWNIVPKDLESAIENFLNN